MKLSSPAHTLAGTRCLANVHNTPALVVCHHSPYQFQVTWQHLQVEVWLAHAGGGCRPETFVAHMWFCQSSGLARQSSGLKTGTTATTTTTGIAAATWRIQQAAIGASNCQSGSVDKGSVCRRKGVTCLQAQRCDMSGTPSMEGGPLMVCLLFRPLHQMPI